MGEKLCSNASDFAQNMWGSYWKGSHDPNVSVHKRHKQNPKHVPSPLFLAHIQSKMKERNAFRRNPFP